MGNSSNSRDVYAHDSHLMLDNGEMSTGIVRENGRGGLDLEFD